MFHLPNRRPATTTRHGGHDRSSLVMSFAAIVFAGGIGLAVADCPNPVPPGSFSTAQVCRTFQRCSDAVLFWGSSGLNCLRCTATLGNRSGCVGGVPEQGFGCEQIYFEAGCGVVEVAGEVFAIDTNGDGIPDTWVCGDFEPTEDCCHQAICGMVPAPPTGS